LRFEELGDNRLREIAVAHRGETAETLIERISAEVQAFCGEAPKADDMTIVVVRRVT
jgi:serine phosphatase RsbU (regulator of sigma subunit)